MEDLFTCKCGCTQFINVTPHQYLKSDMNRWGSFGHRVFGIAPVLICLTCQHITVPPINMSGKSRLDPNVKAYADLLEWVKKCNEETDSAQKNLEVIQRHISMNHELVTRIQSLEASDKKEED